MGCDAKGCAVRTPFRYCERHGAEQLAKLEAECVRIAEESGLLSKRLVKLTESLAGLGSQRAPSATYPPGVPDAVIAVQHSVAAHLGVTVHDLQVGGRRPELVRARHLAVGVVRQVTRASLPVIGKAFHLHHTSVLHAIRQADRATVRRLAAAISQQPCPLDVRRIGPLDATAALRESRTCDVRRAVSSGHRRPSV